MKNQLNNVFWGNHIFTILNLTIFYIPLYYNIKQDPSQLSGKCREMEKSSVCPQPEPAEPRQPNDQLHGCSRGRHPPGGWQAQCTVGQSPKGMMVFIYIGHYQGCRVLKCVQGCCRVCPGVLQNVCRDTECVQGAVLTSSLAQQD